VRWSLIIAIFASAYALICLMLYAGQRDRIYFRTAEVAQVEGAVPWRLRVDDAVPPKHATRLVEALESAGVPTEVLRIEAAGHNTLDMFPAYLDAVEQFVAAAPS
jgi:fermentation-respiration switch protein FrsA (DUF1100 family)